MVGKSDNYFLEGIETGNCSQYPAISNNNNLNCKGQLPELKDKSFPIQIKHIESNWLLRF